MTAIKDITGQRFGRLVARRFVELQGPPGRGRAVWEFACDCGRSCVARAQDVKAAWHSGHCPECVRLSKIARTYVHGGTGTRLHRIWIGARQRCRNPKDKHWPGYGGRGVTFAPEWDDFATFRAWSLANGYTDRLELDRRDNDGPYSPQNCRWVGRRAQCRNTRRTRYVEYRGRRMSLAALAEETGVNRNTLQWRIDKTGLTPEEAVARPSDLCASGSL